MSLSHMPSLSAAAEHPQPSPAAVNDTAASARQHPVTSALTQGETDDLPPTDPRHPLNNSTSRALLAGLGFLDRFLALWVLLAMILGVIIGGVPSLPFRLSSSQGRGSRVGPYSDDRSLSLPTGKFASNVDAVLTSSTLKGVSVPIVVGLLVMMWPILTKVQYEKLPEIFSHKRMWYQIGISLVLNWIVGPFIMLAVAWATLPDLPTYRTGVIMVGLARCIAMVMIWNQLAQGDGDYCAILVIINSILQIVLYSPMSLLFVNVIGGDDTLKLDYSNTAIAVVIYLGIPLIAGIVTRFTMLWLLGPAKFQTRFLPYFSPFALVGLLFTIILIFAEQAQRILDNLGPTFRVFVPMILYFAIMWSLAFYLVWWMSRRPGLSKYGGYDMAVVQSFTAASNNFELAIAVCIAIYGVNSDQALAATIGPLVEVPVLLALTWLALFFKRRLKWDEREVMDGDTEKQV